MNTPTPEKIDHYLHGLLTPDEAERIERMAREDAGCREAVEAGRRRMAALAAASPPTEPTTDLARRTLQRLDDQDAARAAFHRQIWRGVVTTFATAAAVLLAFGLYFESVQAAPVNLELIGQTQWSADSTGGVRVRLTNPTTGKPFVDRLISLTLRNPLTAEILKLAEFRTDSSGTGRVSFRIPDWDSGAYELLAVATTEYGSDQLSRQIQLRRPAKLMLSTDKPVYQPGQTIHARALALRKPHLKPISGREAVFTVTDPKGNVIFKATPRLSDYGIASADCDLANELIEGSYVVRCAAGDVVSSTQVEVKKYVLPKFRVGIESDRPYFKPGQTAAVVLRADYFFGQPVADAAVQIEVAGQDVKPFLVEKRSLTTAADGRAEFSFRIPDRLAGSPRDGGRARLTVTATVRDGGGQEQSRTKSLVVSAEDLIIDVLPEAGVLVPNVENRVYLYVSTADGQPATAHVRVSSDDLPEQSVTTSAMGVGVLTVRPDGNQQLQLEASTDAGLHGRRRVDLMSAVSDFIVRPDKAVVRGGDTLTLDILGGGREPVFIDLLREGQTVLTETVVPENGHGSLTVDIPADWSGAVEIHGYRFDGAGVGVRKTRTVFVRPAGQLDIRVETDRPEYRPGETARFTFQLSDSTGRPVPGALSLAAVDEAVFAVLEQMPGTEQAFFLLDPELLRPVYTIYPWSPGDLQPIAGREQFDLALFSATAGEKSDPLPLSASTYPEREQEARRRKERGVQLVKTGFGWLVELAVLALAVAVFQSLSSRSRIVLAGSLTLIGLLVLVARQMNDPMVDTFSQVMSKIDNIIATRSGFDRAVPGRIPEVDSGIEGGPTIRVRDRFPETLLWRPQLVTDDRGRATVEVPLADSITTWRLTASAVSAEGRLGAARSGVRVFQPFFVDLNLPVALTRGDTVEVPVVVSNFLDAAQSVSVSLAAADWFELLSDTTVSLELGPRQVRSVGFRLRAKRVGRHDLEVRATTPALGDAVRRTVEIVPEGRKVETVVNATLTAEMNPTFHLPADAVEGSGQLFLKVYPSGFSQLVEGLDGLFQMPYGCFEQTSSTTYPNVLALDYLRRTRQAQPAVEAKARQYIHLGYQRLLTFEVNGGGFDWYGRPPANLMLTAYGLLEFRDMAVVHEVDPRLIQRTRRWLMNQQKPDGSWSDVGRFLNRGAGPPDDHRTTAYVLWSVAGEEHVYRYREARDYLLRTPAEAIDDPYTLAITVLALRGVDPNDATALAYADRLEQLKRTSADAKLCWWELPATATSPFFGRGMAGNVEATATAALALMRVECHPASVRGALSWLVSTKGTNGTWHSTQATVLALKALIAGSTTPLGRPEAKILELAVNGVAETVTIPANQGDVLKQMDLSRHLQTGDNRVSLRELGDTAPIVQWVFRHHVPESPPAADEPLAIRLNYDREELSVGGAVAVTADVENRTTDAMPMIILDLPIPPGFVVERDEWDRAVAQSTIDRYEVTPRQVIVYLRSLEPGRPLRLQYRLRATLPVTATTAAPVAYEYYDPSRRGRGSPGRVVVQ